MREPLTDAWIQADPKPTEARNHGAVWSPANYELLKRLWFDEEPIDSICQRLGRSRLSVVSKLQMLHLVTYNQQARQYDPLYLTDANHTTQENIMSAANIETKTFINGIDAAQLTDDQIFQRIANIEKKIDALTAIRAKSTKIQAAIASLEADVQSLVAFVDAR